MSEGGAREKRERSEGEARVGAREERGKSERETRGERGRSERGARGSEEGAKEERAAKSTCGQTHLRPKAPVARNTCVEVNTH